MGYSFGNSSAGKPPRGTDVYVEEDFDEQGKSLGFFVKTKTSPPKVLQGPFNTQDAADEWIVANGYSRVPKP